MARMRSLKPEFWLDRKLARLLTRDERMLYLGLWNQADEWGRLAGDPRVVLGQVFPYEDDLDPAIIETMLKALAVAGVVQMYEVDGDPYLFLPKLAKHQRLEPSKVPSRHPEPPEVSADSAPDQQVHTDPEPGDNSSEPDPSAAQTSLRAIRAKHVACSREHVAGSRGADESAPTPPPPKRGTRIPDDFEPGDDDRQWARDRGFTDPQITEITGSFVRYWRAKSGRDATKLDWPGTWQNWVAKEDPKRVRVPSASRSYDDEPWMNFR